jgi:hypothetical protein
MRPSECSGHGQHMQSIRWLIMLLYKLGISPNRELAQPLGKKHLILVDKIVIK